MNKIPIPSRDEIVNPLERELAYDDEILYIRKDGEWVPLCGVLKQNTLVPGDNINETDLLEKDTASLVQHVDTNTWALTNGPKIHKGLVKLCEVENSAFLPLINAGSRDWLGGECILSVTVDGKTTFNHEYIINVADGDGFEKGCSIQGGSGSNVKAAICLIDQKYLGLYYQSTTGNIPTKLEMWFQGWDCIEDRSLLNTNIGKFGSMRFIARA